MSSDHSQPGDLYGISEYTSQSFTAEATKPMRSSDTDIRGNTILKPRGIPTQAEADRITKE